MVILLFVEGNRSVGLRARPTPKTIVLHKHIPECKAETKSPRNFREHDAHAREQGVAVRFPLGPVRARNGNKRGRGTALPPRRAGRVRLFPRERRRPRCSPWAPSQRPGRGGGGPPTLLPSGPGRP